MALKSMIAFGKKQREMKNSKKDIAIIGGGISGLVSAFELSEDPRLNISLIEGSDTCGGKMKGYFNEEKQQFEEHSIRALASTYFDKRYLRS